MTTAMKSASTKFHDLRSSPTFILLTVCVAIFNVISPSLDQWTWTLTGMQQDVFLFGTVRHVILDSHTHANSS